MHFVEIIMGMTMFFQIENRYFIEQNFKTWTFQCPETISRNTGILS